MLAKRLKLLRSSAGLTQLQLSANMGININTLASYEKGTREPNVEVLIKFAKYYGCTTDYLLGVSDVRTADPDEKNDIILAQSRLIEEYQSKLNRLMDICLEPGGNFTA